MHRPTPRGCLGVAGNVGFLLDRSRNRPAVSSVPWSDIARRRRLGARAVEGACGESCRGSSRTERGEDIHVRFLTGPAIARAQGVTRHKKVVARGGEAPADERLLPAHGQVVRRRVIRLGRAFGTKSR